MRLTCNVTKEAAGEESIQTLIEKAVDAAIRDDVPLEYITVNKEEGLELIKELAEMPEMVALGITESMLAEIFQNDIPAIQKVYAWFNFIVVCIRVKIQTAAGNVK